MNDNLTAFEIEYQELIAWDRAEGQRLKPYIIRSAASGVLDGCRDLSRKRYEEFNRRHIALIEKYGLEARN